MRGLVLLDKLTLVEVFVADKNGILSELGFERNFNCLP